jgi:CheY-like chemotaxis protein/anti-sigma regulatory factor (Ser/Thr protein kinase)
MSGRPYIVPDPIPRRRVLLIEPSPESNSELADLFDETVWIVHYAKDNTNALLLAQEVAFDLILTSAETTCAEDVEMLRRLRAVRPHTRVIILTKQWMPGDILKAIRNHAFSYFALPIAKPELRDLIEHAVEEPVWDDGIETIQGTPQHVVLAVRCDLRTLDRLTQFVRESVVLPPQEAEDVAFAFREVVMNAMEHGGRFDPQKFVEVGYLKSRRMVMCRVKDPGEGFSLDEIHVAEITGPLVEYAEKTKGGQEAEVPACSLGLLIAQKFVDELIFSEKGNEAFLIKYLPTESKVSVLRKEQ